MTGDSITNSISQFPTRDDFGEKRIISLVGVKIGDKFMRSESVGWSASRYIVVECTKTTPKQATIGGNGYWIENACRVGQRYDRLMIIDQDKLEQSNKEMKLLKFRRELSDINWEKVQDHTVIAAIHLLRGK